MAQATATVLGGFWPANSVSSLTQISKGSARRRVAEILAGKSAMPLRALMLALDGVAPGATATKTLARIANNTELGGKRTIETETLISRATTAGDVTAINADVLSLTARTTSGSSPVANKDLNPLGYR